MTEFYLSCDLAPKEEERPWELARQGWGEASGGTVRNAGARGSDESAS